jgi:hypothetical protein
VKPKQSGRKLRSYRGRRSLHECRNMDDTMRCSASGYIGSLIRQSISTLSRLMLRRWCWPFFIGLLHGLSSWAFFMGFLHGPVYRCSQVCRQFEQLMKVFSGKSKTDFRDWTEMEFMRGDINGFIGTIGGYKSTISVGLGTVTMLAAIPCLL